MRVTARRATASTNTRLAVADRQTVGAAQALVGILCAVCVAVAAVGVGAPSAGADSPTQWLARVNAFRQQNGLRALAIDPQLQALAQQRSDANAAGRTLVHTPDLTVGVTSHWSKLGENVGVGPNPDSLWAAFLASPTHRANILDPEYTHIGFGETQSGPLIWVTHRFMTVTPATTNNPSPTTSAPTGPNGAPSSSSAQSTQAPVTIVVSSPAPGRPGTHSGAPTQPGSSRQPSSGSSGQAGAEPSLASTSGATSTGSAPTILRVTPDIAAIVDALRALQQ